LTPLVPHGHWSPLRRDGKSVLVLRFEDLDRAIQVLDAAGLRGMAARELFSHLPEPILE
jgi:hypothetical protein